MTTLGVIRGASETDILNKKFNLYIGVSLGNKWFTQDNIREHMRWCLQHTKKRVAVLIADTLHAINYEVRNKRSKQAAEQRARREGEKFVTLVKEIIAELPASDRERIDIVLWDDVKKEKFNQQAIPFFFKEFEKNQEFQSAVKEIVISYLGAEKNNFTEAQITRLCHYILYELPEILHGFWFNDTLYDCYTYPQDGLLTKFVEDIQERKRFPHIREQLGPLQNVFAELKVP